MLEKVDGHSLGRILRQSPSQASALMMLFTELFAHLHGLDWRKIMREIDPSADFRTLTRAGQLERSENDIALHRRDELNSILEWLKKPNRTSHLRGFP
jgi:hypothetical protein